MIALAARYSTPQVGLVQYALPLVALVVVSRISHCHAAGQSVEVLHDCTQTFSCA